MRVFVTIVLASAGFLNGVLEALTGMISQYGYPAVFAAAFIEVIFPPIPSEVIFPLVGFTAQSGGLGLGNAIGMATTGALGSTAGAIIIYFASMKVGRAAIVRFGKRIRVSELEIEKAEKWFAKYGAAAVFTGRMVPGIREIISIPAGISRMNFVKFVAYTFAGSLAWCIILTLAGYYLGEAWKGFSDEASSVFNVVSVVVIVSIVVGIGIWYARHKRAPAKSND